MKLKLTVDGKVYEVDVEVAEPEPAQPSYLRPASPTRISAAQPLSPSPGALPAAAPASDASVADESKVCRSPISGVVVRVSAQIGQQIKAHDVLLVLEAMKMETVITSPCDGKIAKVNVTVGDSVKGNQVLIELE